MLNKEHRLSRNWLYTVQLCMFFVFNSLSWNASAASKTNHEYYVSVTRMEYNASAKSWEISLKIFTDDLEKALETYTNKKVTIRNNDANDPLIGSYLSNRFQIKSTTNKVLPYTYVGKEIEADATWIYLELTEAPNELTGAILRNSVLIETYDSQVNMVTIKNGTTKKTYLFKKGKEQQAL